MASETTNPAPKITETPLDDSDYGDEDDTPLVGTRGKFSGKKIAIIVVILVCLGVVIGVVAWKLTSESKNQDCPTLTPPAHASMNCTNAAVDGDAKCNFTCEEGYSMFGLTQLICSNGKWNGTPPHCDLACPNLNPPAHGGLTCEIASAAANECTFSCDKKYQMVGNENVTCANGTWIGELPICFLPCPHLNRSANGNISCSFATIEPYEKCEFTCDNGYNIDGPRQINCTKDGNWSGNPPTCYRVCPKLKPPSHGNMSCTNGTLLANESCTFSCDDGYTVEGPEQLNCTKGNWSGIPPFCDKPCKNLKPPVHGGISCTNASEGTDATCTFTCAKGYAILGPTRVNCTNGNWTGNPPVCRKPCPHLNPPSHGNINCTIPTRDTNETCEFSCEKGYVISGSDQLTCSNGNWSGKSPVCLKGCPDLSDIKYSSINCTDGDLLNSTCNVTCTENHHIHGNKSLTCEADGQWSHPMPNCTCQTCYVGTKCDQSISWNDVAAILDGIKTFSSPQVHYGGKTFTCSTSLYSLIPWRYKGKCTDDETKQTSTCVKYSSRPEAAKHAAADLIRKLVNQTEYPEPCDPDDMDTGCTQALDLAVEAV